MRTGFLKPAAISLRLPSSDYVDAAFWCDCRRTGLRARTKLERTLKLGQSLLRRGEISALKFAAGCTLDSVCCWEGSLMQTLVGSIAYRRFPDIQVVCQNPSPPAIRSRLLILCRAERNSRRVRYPAGAHSASASAASGQSVAGQNVPEILCPMNPWFPRLYPRNYKGLTIFDSRLARTT
jgi:hypothetical protein